MKQEYVIRYYDLNTGYHAFVGKAQKPIVFASQAEAEQYLQENPAQSLPSHGDRYAMRYEVVKFWRMERPAELGQPAPGPQSASGPGDAQLPNQEDAAADQEPEVESPALAKVLKGKK